MILTPLLTWVIAVEPAATTAPASAPATAATGSEGSRPEFQRVGSTVALGVGMQSCRQFFCDDKTKFNGGKLGIGPSLSLDFGLRPHTFFDVTGGFTAAYLPVKNADSGDFSQGWYSIHALARFFPLRHGRWDPYVGAGLGFFQFWSWSGIRDIDRIFSFSRANLILTTGLDIYVTPKFSVGPRVAYNVTFGGRYCYWYEDNDKQCRRAKSFKDSDLAQGEGKNEQVMPRPWEFGVTVKWHR